MMQKALGSQAASLERAVCIERQGRSILIYLTLTLSMPNTCKRFRGSLRSSLGGCIAHDSEKCNSFRINLPCWLLWHLFIGKPAQPSWHFFMEKSLANSRGGLFL